MWRAPAVMVVTLAVALTAIVALAAQLVVEPSTLATFTIPARPEQFPPVPATLDIKPESLEKKSQGTPVTAFVELPQGFDVSSIDVSSVLLCRGTELCTDGVAPDAAPAAKPKVGDADNDGIPDLKVTFDRAAVINLVADVEPPATVPFTVSGLVDPPGRLFAGSDTVNLVAPKR